MRRNYEPAGSVFLAHGTGGERRCPIKLRASLLAIFAAALLISGAAAQQSRPQSQAAPAAKAQSATQAKLEMRKLWEDHITYTRNYIISALADVPDADAVSKRLLKNQDEIGDAIKPYYGEDAGKKLSGLLRDHILIATEVVKAAKADQKDQLADAQKKWSANGKDIAAFLSGANPNWPKQSLEDMLQKHLDLTTGEVVGRLKQDWEGDIRSYDEGHVHMLMFADTLTDGIAKQFPDMFSASTVGQGKR
jgi:hypothetical protein